MELHKRLEMLELGKHQTARKYEAESKDPVAAVKWKALYATYEDLIAMAQAR